VKGAGAKALDANDYFLLDTATGTLMVDPDGTGPSTPISMVQFVGFVDPAFSASDIYIGV
jgi:hypothetical protein